MKRFFKTGLSIILALTIVFSSAYVGFSEVDFADIKFENPFAVKTKAASSGTCGDNLTWTLDDNGTLTISGTGTMNGYYFEMGPCAPWYNYRYDIKKVIINEGVKSIGSDAFAFCGSLTSIAIPDSVISIGSNAFYYSGYYNNESNWESGVLYIGNHLIAANKYGFYDGQPSYIGNVSGEYIIKNGTKTIAGSAFSDCKDLISIKIPDSVISIGVSAFSDCENLDAVHITDISKWYSISFGSSAANPLYYAKKLYLNEELITDFVIPNSVTSIGDYVFSGYSSLTSIIIPDSVTSIGSGAFYNCKSLNSITIPNSVMSIGKEAFYNCESLISIEIPDKVTSIGDHAFCLCDSLTTITIPDSVTSIGIDAFSSSGFYENESNWENGVLYVGNHLVSAYTYGGEFGDAYISNVSGEYIVKNGTKTIADYAFNYCRNLTSITIPDSLISIGDSTFYGCASLASITIPDGVTSIGESAFYNCTSLKDVYYSGTETDWVAISIGSNNKRLTGATIHFHEHSYIGDWVIDSDATCTETGTKHKTCSDCGDIVTEVIPAKDHTAVKDAAVAATCTTAGKTEGKHCSVCNTVIVAQQTVPAKGHTASELKYNSETRTEYKECTVCKVILESKYIPLATTAITSCYNEVKGVQLKWNAVTDAVKYDIYRKTSTQSSWTKITSTSELAYQDTSVTGNTIYQYKIKAVDQYGNQSDYSAQRECRFIATPVLESISNAVGGIKITWGKVAGATSYRIYRRGAGTNYWYYLGDVSSTQNTFFDKESSLVKSGNYYRYTVRASYSGKDSAGKDYLIYSGFDTNGLYIKYMASPKLTSITNATGGLQIKWNKVSGGKDLKYNVYRRGAGSSTWKYLGSTTGTTWTDSEVKNSSGNYYRYTVRAIDGYYSAFDATGLFLMRLANPTIKSATSAKAGITVKWNAVAGTTGYYVYRKTANSGWTRIASVGGTNTTSYLDKTAQKGVTYVYTVRAVYGSTTSYFNSGISCKDKY